MKWDVYAKVLVLRNNGIGQYVDGTDTFYVIRFEDIPKEHLKEVCYTSVVCKVSPGKNDPNQTRITIFGTNVCYPGDVGTNMASLELFQIMINSTLSRKGAKFSCLEAEKFIPEHHLGGLST